MLLKKLKRQFLCLIAMHDWTCNAMENIPPTAEHAKAGIEGFFEYTKIYCKHCKKILGGRCY